MEEENSEKEKLKELNEALISLNFKENVHDTNKRENEKSDAKQELTIIMGNQKLCCDRNLLKQKCKYFEAFLNFEPDRTQVEIKGYFQIVDWYRIIEITVCPGSSDPF